MKEEFDFYISIGFVETAYYKEEDRGVTFLSLIPILRHYLIQTDKIVIDDNKIQIMTTFITQQIKT